MSKSKKYCRGCRDDFYNGNNDLGVKECWNLKSAEVVKKLAIPINLRPPYNHIKPEDTYGCHRRKGYCMVNPEAIASDGYWRR